MLTSDNFIEQLEDDNHLDFVLPENEVNGFHYLRVLRFVVHKFRKTYPFLKSSEEKENDWIAYKNRKGLCRVFPRVLAHFKKVEETFRDYHGDKLLVEGQGAVSRLLESVHPSIALPREVIEYYLRCRIYLRIKHLNQAVKMEKARKNMRKMKKLVI